MSLLMQTMHLLDQRLGRQERHMAEVQQLFLAAPAPAHDHDGVGDGDGDGDPYIQDVHGVTAGEEEGEEGEYGLGHGGEGAGEGHDGGHVDHLHHDRSFSGPGEAHDVGTGTE
jgi:hypothetical protein